MVSNTSELLPEPETPVNAVRRRFGISTLTSLRLFTRAPSTRIRSWLSAACAAVLIVVPSLPADPAGAVYPISGVRRKRRDGLSSSGEGWSTRAGDPPRTPSGSPGTGRAPGTGHRPRRAGGRCARSRDARTAPVLRGPARRGSRRLLASAEDWQFPLLGQPVHARLDGCLDPVV